MFSQTAVRSIVAMLILSSSIFGGLVPAFAQTAATAEATAPSRQTTAELEPFGLNAIPVTGGEVLAKWNRLVDDIRVEREILLRCREGTESCPKAGLKFLGVISEGQAREGRARVGIINRAINLAIQPMSDLAQWGVVDRWSAPLATLTSGRGDCEDYAIAKYVALTEAGVSADDVKIIIVRDLAAGEDHAVVAARVDEKWIVLDNRRLVLVEDVEMRRVLPLFMLSNDGVKQFAPTTLADERNSSAPAPSSLGF
jgi:predicted transglutaminase-like cysteine proteinase